MWLFDDHRLSICCCVATVEGAVMLCVIGHTRIDGKCHWKQIKPTSCSPKTDHHTYTPENKYFFFFCKMTIIMGDHWRVSILFYLLHKNQNSMNFGNLITRWFWYFDILKLLIEDTNLAYLRNWKKKVWFPFFTVHVGGVRQCIFLLKLVHWVGRSGGAGCNSTSRTPNFTWFGAKIAKKGHFWSKRQLFGHRRPRGPCLGISFTLSDFQIHWTYPINKFL